MTTTSTDPRPTVELDDKTRQWVAAYREAKNRVAVDQEILDRCRAQLEAALGDAEVATVDGEPVVHWTVVTSARLDTKKLREARPDVYDEFTRPQVTRRFTVVEP